MLHFCVATRADRLFSFQGSCAVGRASDFTGMVVVDGLTPGTEYVYWVAASVEGSEPSAEEVRNGLRRAEAECARGLFKTSPAKLVHGGAHFLFGSCIGGQGFGRPAGGCWEIFKAMAACKPDFFICLGDFVYADDIVPVAGGPFSKRNNHPGAETKCQTVEQFYERYRYHLEDPALEAFLASTPLMPIWDDHEILDDWGGPKLLKTNPVLLANGSQAFFAYMPLRGVPAEEPYRVYRSFEYGADLEVFLTDCRQYRGEHHKAKIHGQARRQSVVHTDTPYMDTMLGERQFHWLMQGVAASKARWKIVAFSIPLAFPTGWPNPTDDGFDGWSDAGARLELLKLLDFWKIKKVKNLVFITADVHFPACIQYNPPKYFEFWELCSSPLSALALPPSKPEASLKPTVHWSEGSFNSGFTNFGEITIDKGSADLTFQVKDEQGKERFKKVIKAKVD
jgi:alkaline phosphatase D